MGYKQLQGDAETLLVSIDGENMDPKRSRFLRDHSFDFCWGYLGSGPPQLALAILLFLTQDATFSVVWYQEYKTTFVAKWPLHQNISVDLDSTYKWISERNHR